MIGRITHFNPVRKYGFITTTTQVGAGRVQQQYFFHQSNFVVDHEAPVLGALVVFGLGDGIAEGKKVQAVAIRLATATDIEAGAKALAAPPSEVR
jgi:hypothetical protein